MTDETRAPKRSHHAKPPSQGGKTYVDPRREAAEKLFLPRPAILTPGAKIPADAVPDKPTRELVRDEVRRRAGRVGGVVVERSHRSKALDRLGRALARLTRAEAGNRSVRALVADRLTAVEAMVARLAAGETTAARALALVEEAADAARRIAEAGAVQAQPETEPVQLDLVDLLAEPAPMQPTGDLVHDLVQECPAVAPVEPVAADPEPTRRPVLDRQARAQALPYPFTLVVPMPATVPAH